jgi:hypothetical protein
LKTTDSVHTRQKFGYLKKRSDLELRVEAFNAADVESMRSFSRTVTSPIGGCFLMVLHLIDGLFMAQTDETFHTVAQSKLSVFKAFDSVFGVGSLDFFLSFSSMMAVTGNIGQSNYATANAILDGELKRYPNAFSVMIPGISNVGYLARSEGDAEHSRLDSWSITSDGGRMFFGLEECANVIPSGVCVHQGWSSPPRHGKEVFDVYPTLVMGWGREGHGLFFDMRSSSFARPFGNPSANAQRQRNKRS